MQTHSQIDPCFGVTGKIVYESIPRATASALALDIGVQYTGLASRRPWSCISLKQHRY